MLFRSNATNPLLGVGRAILLDRTRPTGDVVDVVPDPHPPKLGTIDVVFSEPIDPNTFDYSDLSLTRDGGANLITSSVTVSKVSGNTWRIGGLESLNELEGTYTVAVNMTSIRDALGHLGQGTISDSWVAKIPVTEIGRAHV